MTKKLKTCVTPEARVSYPNVFKAASYNGGPEKYSIVLTFDKAIDLNGLKKLCLEVAIEAFGPREKWEGKKVHMPFRDGDDERPGADGFKNCVFLNASSLHAPGIVDQGLKRIISEDVFYAGCYARAELNAFAYDKAGRRGVSFGLLNLQKTKDGAKFTSISKPEDVFEKLEDTTPTSFDDLGDIGF